MKVLNNKLAYFKANGAQYCFLTDDNLQEDTNAEWIKLPNGVYYVNQTNISNVRFPTWYMVILKWSLNEDIILLGIGMPKGALYFRSGNSSGFSKWHIVTSTDVE